MNNPTKEKVREYTERRKVDHTPPPTPDQIRRELGWELLENNDPSKTGFDKPR